MLGLPNPNVELRTYRLHRKPDPNVKVASTGDDNKTPLNYVSVKRPRKALGITTGTTDYATDPVLQASLLAACRKGQYPLLKGAGTDTTARVPVYILSMDLADTFESRRNVHNGAGYFCQCGVWRLKTQQEAEKDKLPWNEDRIAEYMDDEAYHIGDATRQEWATQGQGKDARTTRTGPRKIVECNPYTCPYPRETGKKKCKLGVTIYLKARDWGNDTPFRVECVSWETNARFPASWDLVRLAAQGLLLGCPLDLVLDWSKPKGTPDGTTRPRPFWTLALPWGMTEEQMRRVALDRARGIIADKREAQDLEMQLQELNAVARLPISERARLQEHEELPALPPASEAAPLSLSERDLAARLVNEWDMDALQAAAIVRANSGDLEGMMDRMGPPPDAAVEGVLEPEDEAQPGDSDAADWTVEQDMMDEAEEGVLDDDLAASHEAEAVPGVQPEVIAAPATEDPFPADYPGVPNQLNVAARAAMPEPYTNESAPDTTDLPPALLDTPSLMFPTPPESCYAIEKRFEDIGEKPDFERLCVLTWKKATGRERTLVPSPGTCESPEQFEACLAELLRRAELWWHKIGRAKHEAA
jgi:hypothetical protein